MAKNPETWEEAFDYIHNMLIEVGKLPDSDPNKAKRKESFERIKELFESARDRGIDWEFMIQIWDKTPEELKTMARELRQKARKN
jgi:hypothetical protein